MHKFKMKVVFYNFIKIYVKILLLFLIKKRYFLQIIISLQYKNVISHFMNTIFVEIDLFS